MGHRRSAAEARDPSGPPPSERVFGYFLRVEKVPRPQAKYLYPPATQFWYRGLCPLWPPSLRGKNGASSSMGPGGRKKKRNGLTYLCNQGIIGASIHRKSMYDQNQKGACGHE